jgi:hypothetical protein
MRKEFDSDVRFILMNSFSTSKDTTEHLKGTHPDLVAEHDWELVQNKSPKVDAATMAPASYAAAPEMEWCENLRTWGVERLERACILNPSVCLAAVLETCPLCCARYLQTDMNMC